MPPTKTLLDKEKLDCEVMNCSSPPRRRVDGIFALHSVFIENVLSEIMWTPHPHAPYKAALSTTFCPALRSVQLCLSLYLPHAVFAWVELVEVASSTTLQVETQRVVVHIGPFIEEHFVGFIFMVRVMVMVIVFLLTCTQCCCCCVSSGNWDGSLATRAEPYCASRVHHKTWAWSLAVVEALETL